MGLGRVFERFHLPALQSGVGWTLVGVVDSSGERLGWAAERCAGVRTADSLAHLATELHPDAVLISTPPDSHAALAALALRIGAHVLIEKPMVLSSGEAGELLDLARTLQRHVRVGFNRRFRPAYVELRKLVTSGSANAVQSLSFELCTNPRGWESVSSYLGNTARGGGLLDDVGSHQVDLVPWIMGRRVDAIRARELSHDERRSVMLLQLRFEGGIVAQCLAGHTPAYAERMEVELNGRLWTAGPGGLRRSGMLGARASHEYLRARGAFRSLTCKLSRRPGDTLETFRRQFIAWAEELRGGAAPGSTGAADGREGAGNIALLEACRRSLQLQGSWIDTH